MTAEAPSRVTVIMAVRNGERFLTEALASLEAQTRPADEILLIDGGSTDETLSIAAGHPEVTVIHQVGPNLSSAYNEGIAAATGDTIAFLSHDDRWAPIKLEAQCDALRADPEIDFVGGHVRFFLHGATAVPRGFRAELLDGPVPAPLCLEALLVRTTIARAAAPFREDLPVVADLAWTDEVRRRSGGGVVLDEVVLEKRIHESNTSLAGVHDAGLLAAVRGSLRARRRP